MHFDTNIRDEYEVSKCIHKYRNQNMEGQIEKNNKDGYINLCMKVSFYN